MAEQGKSNEARENLLRGMDERDAPPDIAWYVLGRIAEDYGLGDAAAALYRKVAEPKASNDRLIFNLAKRRLKKQPNPLPQ